MSELTDGIDNPEIWDAARIARAKVELEQAQVEIAAEEAKRAAAQAADKAATLTPEQREAAEMRGLGETSAVDGRRKVLAEFGFDPGWR
jgi:hypothetical protein